MKVYMRLIGLVLVVTMVTAPLHEIAAHLAEGEIVFWERVVFGFIVALGCWLLVQSEEQ